MGRRLNLTQRYHNEEQAIDDRQPVALMYRIQEHYSMIVVRTR